MFWQMSAAYDVCLFFTADLGSARSGSNVSNFTSLYDKRLLRRWKMAKYCKV